MSKYVIKNCPVAFNTRVDGTYCNDVEIANGKNIHCQYITDCVMKQIVELCNRIKCPCEYKGVDCWECAESGARRFADKILKLLDIQEVE